MRALKKSMLLCMISLIGSTLIASEQGPDLYQRVMVLVQLNNEQGLGVIAQRLSSQFTPASVARYVNEDIFNSLREHIETAILLRAQSQVAQGSIDYGPNIFNRRVFKPELFEHHMNKPNIREFLLFNLPPAEPIKESAMGVPGPRSSTIFSVMQEQNQQRASTLSPHAAPFEPADPTRILEQEPDQKATNTAKRFKKS